MKAWIHIKDNDVLGIIIGGDIDCADSMPVTPDKTIEVEHDSNTFTYDYVDGEAVPVDNEEIMRRMNDPEDTTVVTL